jgi:oligopeptidase A
MSMQSPVSGRDSRPFHRAAAIALRTPDRVLESPAMSEPAAVHTDPTTSTNPLLAPTPLPAYSAIRPEHVAPAVDAVLGEGRALLAGLADAVAPDWDAVFGPLEAFDDRLTRAWSPVAHLNAVMNSAALREQYNACLPKLADWETELGQHEGLYRTLAMVETRAEALGLDATRRKVLGDHLRDFRLAGVHLPPAEKKRFKEVSQELSVLEARFEEQVLDATGAWTRLVADVAALRGLPADAIERARERAAEKGHDGWLLTLDAPCYVAVVTHADDRALREETWTAYATRASDQGPHAGQHDNSQVMRDILKLRGELARLVGFEDFASYSLTTKMAAQAGRVRAFLDDLVQRVKPAAAHEFAALEDFALTALGLAQVEAWDLAYVAEKLRQRRYAVSQQELRAYFPAERVIDGLFELLGRIYGLNLEPVTGVDVWHPDVRFYAVRDGAGALRGHLYMDLYARAKKRSGAWMDECLNRQRKLDGVQTPVAHLVCNFPAPTASTPSLLTHDEVLTLFHEMGHCLHHLLTQVDVADAAGINGVAWDAIELPSQFHELFAWDPRVLALVSGHHATGEPLPETLAAKLIAARNFNAALAMLRQLEFGLFDMTIHAGATPPEPQAALAAVRAAVAVAPKPAWDRFAHAFSHVFAGGYAAGYYGYLWAEVLASDAFAAFEEQGVLDRATGERFMREILERGGSREPLELFTAFRGREPALDAFLRHHGIGVSQ